MVCVFILSDPHFRNVIVTVYSQEVRDEVSLHTMYKENVTKNLLVSKSVVSQKRLLIYLPFVFTEEEKRRALEHSYHAIRFSYNKEEPPASTQEAARVVVSQPRRMEHPPSCSVDTGDGDVFVLPEGLVVPEGIKMVCTLMYVN